MDGLIGGWVGGQMGEWAGGWLDDIGSRLDKLVSALVDGWTNAQLGGYRN